MHNSSIDCLIHARELGELGSPRDARSRYGGGALPQQQLWLKFPTGCAYVLHSIDIEGDAHQNTAVLRSPESRPSFAGGFR
jgi:hypothetical protein